MKALLSVVLALALTLAGAAAAPAHIVEMTTSVTLPAPASEDDLKEAVATAARGVLSNLDPPLQPAVMAITAAYLRAGRLYVRFLIADEAGARLLGVWDGAAPAGERDHLRL